MTGVCMAPAYPILTEVIMNFLNKLERKCGQYAVKNLINYLLIGYGIGYILELLSPDIYSALQLSPALVMKGQVWRLFTWILTTPESLGFFTIFMFMFYYWIGHTLENYWGTFRYNVYMISGYLIMTIGAMLIYGITYLTSGGTFAISLSMSTYYVNMASFLAFATLFGDAQVLFMLIIPIKMKWLAIVDAVYLGYECLANIARYFQITGDAQQLAYYALNGLQQDRYCQYLLFQCDRHYSVRTEFPHLLLCHKEYEEIFPA